MHRLKDVSTIQSITNQNTRDCFAFVRVYFREISRLEFKTLRIRKGNFDIRLGAVAEKFRHKTCAGHSVPLVTDAARVQCKLTVIANPNVLKVFTPRTQLKFLYHVTEYFEGKTLQQWMLDNPKPDLEPVRSIVEQIVLGLRAMHRKDILHLDLKPSIVMIDAQGLVKLIDFGSSLAASTAENSKTKFPAGTADYAAPEHLLGAKPSSLSDLYSLGVITYEMLTGSLPYGAGFKSASQIARAQYLPAMTRRKDIPDWIDAALEEAVQLTPQRRTEVLSAFVENLRKPNSGLKLARDKPMLERNPLLFWKLLSLALFIACIAITLLTASHR
jgi:serine/threonine protein kinase